MSSLSKPGSSISGDNMRPTAHPPRSSSRAPVETSTSIHARSRSSATTNSPSALPLHERINDWSLLPYASHNLELLMLLSSKELTREMVTHIAKVTEEVVLIEGEDVARTRSMLPSPPVTPTRPHGGPYPRYTPLPSLISFILQIVGNSRVLLPTLLCTLIYLDRLRDRIPRIPTAVTSARHRVFLATLIVTSKYLNDGSPRNVLWASYANNMFEPREINLMEIQLLDLLEHELRFTEQDAITHLKIFFPSTIARAHAIKMAARGSSIRAPLTPITPTHDTIPASHSSILGDTPSLSHPTPSSGSSTSSNVAQDIHSSSDYASAGSLTDDHGTSSSDEEPLPIDPYHPSLHGHGLIHKTDRLPLDFKLHPVPANAYRFRKRQAALSAVPMVNGRSITESEDDSDHIMVDMGSVQISPSPTRPGKNIFYVTPCSSESIIERPSRPSNFGLAGRSSQPRKSSSSSTASFRTVHAGATPHAGALPISASVGSRPGININLGLSSTSSIPSLARSAKESITNLWSHSSGHGSESGSSGLSSGGSNVGGSRILFKGKASKATSTATAGARQPGAFPV